MTTAQADRDAADRHLRWSAALFALGQGLSWYTVDAAGLYWPAVEPGMWILVAAVTWATVRLLADCWAEYRRSGAVLRLVQTHGFWRAKQSCTGQGRPVGDGARTP